MKKRAFSFFLALSLILALMPYAPAGATTFGPDDNRNIYADLDHSYDDAIAEALVDHVEDLGDQKYGLRGKNHTTFVKQVQYVQFTHPEIVGIKDFYTTFLAGSSYILGYYAVYADADELYAAFYDRLPEVTAEVERLIPVGASDLEKVLIAHDYLAEVTAYDQATLDAGTDYENHSIYDASGVFVNHYAVCQGYALAFKYIMDGLGIECALAESNDSSHAWNLVKLGGEWYHVDVTADDMAWDILGRVTHDYFLLSTETLLARSSARADFYVLTDDYDLVFTDNTCAKNKQYESGQYWNGVNTAIHFYNNSVYLFRDGALYKDGAVYFQPDEHMFWHPFGIITAVYGTTYGAISACDNLLYMLSPKHIYRLDLDTGANEIIYSVPEGSVSGTQIFGLARIEGQLYCTLNNNLPTANEEWIPVTGTALPDAPIGLVDTQNNKLVKELALSADSGETVTIRAKNIPAESAVSVVSSEESVATAAYAKGKLTLTCLFDGESEISLTVGETVLTVNLTVNPIYAASKDITVQVGKSVTLSDESGNYASSFALMPDEAVATAVIRGISEAGIPGVDGKTDRLSAPEGSFLIGSGGSYLVKSGSSLSLTSDPGRATLWSVTGSGSGYTVSAGGSYLNHSTSGVSLSSSPSDGQWSYNASGFYFIQSRKILIFTTSTTYYLTVSGGAGVSTTASSAASAYRYTPGTPAVPAREATEITLTGVAEGVTRLLVGSTQYAVTVEAYLAPTVDKTLLKAALDGAVASDGYTAESYAPYQAALSAGQTVYDRSDATQSEVDGALSAILTAKAGLKPVPVIQFTPDSDGIDSGRDYVISYAGKAMAVRAGSLVAIDISDSGSGLSGVPAEAVWVVTSSGSGYTLLNKASGLYLNCGVSGSLFSKSASLKLSASGSAWKVKTTGGKVQFYTTSLLTSFYLSYSGGFTTAKNANSASMSLFVG